MVMERPEGGVLRMGKIVGEYVRKIRKASATSQVDAAQKLGYQTPQAISNIERGVTPFPRNLIAKFAEVFNTSSDGLVEAILEETRQKLTGGSVSAVEDGSVIQTE
jgi:transcriptional regulator with XRE-family HTH domain